MKDNCSCGCNLLRGIKVAGIILGVILGIISGILFYLFYSPILLVSLYIAIVIALILFLVFIHSIFASDKLTCNCSSCSDVKNNLKCIFVYVIIAIIGTIVTSLIGLSVILTQVSFGLGILIGLITFFFTMLITSMILLPFVILFN